MNMSGPPVQVVWRRDATWDGITRWYTYIYSGNFPIHELVLRGGSFKPVTGQLHGIAGIVDVSKDLDGDHGLGVLRHFIYSRQLANDVVPTHDQGQ
jgi:hypothetical protein